MELRVSATDLARKLGEILGGVRYRRDTVVIERNGVPIARLSPWPGGPAPDLAEALRAWREAAAGEEGFAADLERVNRSDRPARDPWASS